jgi:hypothetical protein
MNAERIKELAMSDNGFIFDPTTGYSYNSNEIGFLILKLLQHDHSKADIVKRIAKDYDVSIDHLTHDVDHYIMQLKSLNLIEELDEV